MVVVGEEERGKERVTKVGMGKERDDAQATRASTPHHQRNFTRHSSLTCSLPNYWTATLFHSMDHGHYNCRDYYISPHFAPTTLTNERPLHTLERHESFTELEQRSRSPASQRPKFPLLKLPLELRQEILSYLLPHTQKFKDCSGLTQHVQNFSAVKKRQARGMPAAVTNNSLMTVGTNNVVWQRGNIDVLRVCKQLHDECAELIYGSNTFQLFVSYNGISFRFRWLLASGVAPSRTFEFLKLLNPRYIRLVRKVAITVDLVDSYTGMIKFNVSGKALTLGLRKQVQRLVNALRSGAVQGQEHDHGRLSRVSIRVQNGDNYLEAKKSELVRQRDGSLKGFGDVAEILEPFSDLYGIGSVSVTGAVSEDNAQTLMELMTDKNRKDAVKRIEPVEEDMPVGGAGRNGVYLSVYGNDL